MEQGDIEWKSPFGFKLGCFLHLTMASFNRESDANMYALTEYIRTHFVYNAESILSTTQIIEYLQTEMKLEQSIQAKELKHAMNLVFGKQANNEYGYHLSISQNNTTISKVPISPKAAFSTRLSERQIIAQKSRELRQQIQTMQQKDDLVHAPSHKPTANDDEMTDSECDNDSENPTDRTWSSQSEEVDSSKGAITKINPFFGDHAFRCIYASFFLFICSSFSCSMWFQPTTSPFNAAYGLSGFGAICILIASVMILSYFALKMAKNYMQNSEHLDVVISFYEHWLFWTIKGLYLMGGAFYFFGGCAVAYAWNQTRVNPVSGGIFFAEQTFVGVHAVIIAIDLWKECYLNVKKHRLYVFNGVFLLFVFIAFCCYASISVNFDDAGIRHIGPSFLTLFYFLLLITEIMYLTIYFVPKLNVVFYCHFVWKMLSAMNLFFLCFVFIGYLLLLSEFEGIVGRAYFIGFGLFALANGAGIVYDMSVDGLLMNKESMNEDTNNEKTEEVDVEQGVMSGCVEQTNLDTLIVRE